MSTKTTFKRVALVAVAALGMGVMTSVVPANAAAASFSLNTSSITVVGATTPHAVFAITVTGTAAAPGLAAGETITATVVGVPTTVTTTKTLAANAGDVTFEEIQQSARFGINPVWSGATTDTPTAQSATDGAIGSANSAHYGMNVNLTTAEIATALAAATRTYYFSVNATAAAIDQGVYTIQFDLTNVAGATLQRTNAKVDYVTLPASSGAVLTASSTGQWFVGDTPSIANQSATRAITATIRNRDGGALRNADGSAPTLSAQVADSSTTAIVQVLNAADDLTNERAWSSTVASFPNDGNYSVYLASAFTAVVGDDTLTVRYGLASATATVAIADAATALSTATDSIVATGQVNSGNDATVPLTTKSATFRNAITISGVAQTGYAAYYTLAYSSACIAGDMSPAATTLPTKVLTDATGVASLTVTNASPLNTCAATVTWTGAATNPASTAVVTWARAAAANASASVGSYQALTKSAQSITWTITDQFSNPVANALVAISHTGANAPTVAPAQLTTNAAGAVTYTWTDAKGVDASTTLGSDTLSVATVAGTAPTATLGAVTVTWKTTLSAVASLDAFYAPLTDMASKVVVPTTAIGGSSGRAVSTLDQVDLTKPITVSAAANHFVALQFRALDAAAAAVTGVPTTITVTGGQLLTASGMLASTRTLFANEAFYVVGTKTGTTTVTATNGTLTKTATINFVNVAADARVLKVTEAAGLVTASVTDAFGNNVAGVEVDVVGSGGAWLGNGATSATFKTATDGTVTFAVTGSGTVSASLSRSLYSKPSFLAGAGDSTGTVVTTGAPAGVRSASVATTGYNVTSDTAQAAADAAAEATDAANAATDAANAAAEAADAATAAAQDAADAVAALSTSVSAMISDLKRQITALTNLVIKIQRKVRA
jgi:trimeric autotransporter adhesin